jgi:long-chain-fatty-acid--CoA ligase ACSBG
MKKSCPGLSNVMMVGDKRKYNVLLVTCKVKVDKDGNPTQELDGDACDVDKSCKTVSDAQNSKVWDAYIKKGMSEYNAAATSNAHKVQYHKMLSKDFSVNGGELTATLKLKRSVVDKLYEKEISSLYKD